MRRFYSVPDDFEVVIRVFTTEEDGLRAPAFNGIRWDFAYAEDPPLKELFAIHPDFFDESGDSLPSDMPLPVNCELAARMVLLSEELRRDVHRSRLRESVRFYCQEGGKRVAEGRVTRITGLFTVRSKS